MELMRILSWHAYGANLINFTDRKSIMKEVGRRERETLFISSVQFGSEVRPGLEIDPLMINGGILGLLSPKLGGAE